MVPKYFESYNLILVSLSEIDADFRWVAKSGPSNFTPLFSNFPKWSLHNQWTIQSDFEIIHFFCQLNYSGWLISQISVFVWLFNAQWTNEVISFFVIIKFLLQQRKIDPILPPCKGGSLLKSSSHSVVKLVLNSCKFQSETNFESLQIA